MKNSVLTTREVKEVSKRVIEKLENGTLPVKVANALTNACGKAMWAMSNEMVCLLQNIKNDSIEE
jgi:hypothetical protein